MKKPNHEELREGVQAYFSDCAAKERPLTVTGLALFLGLSSREELGCFKDKKSASLIQKALLKIENSAEEKLFTKDTFSGAKLFLEVNFSRWTDGRSEALFDPAPQLHATGTEQWAK